MNFSPSTFNTTSRTSRPSRRSQPYASAAGPADLRRQQVSGACPLLRVLDRVTAAAGNRIGAAPRAGSAVLGWSVAAAGTVVAAVVACLVSGTGWPEGWTADITRTVNRAVGWMTDHLYSGVPVIGGTADWAGRFTTWVLDPVRDGLQWLPWWAVLLLIAVLTLLIGTWRTALTAVLAMAAIDALDVWDPALDTLSRSTMCGASTGVVPGVVAEEGWDQSSAGSRAPAATESERSHERCP